ncbi:hypothetical protein D3C72_1418090 [compost metagenome]
MSGVDAIRLWCTLSAISPLIFSEVCRNRSSVRDTAPSVEFSTGTTPYSTVPASTARNTSSMLGHGTPLTSWPKWAYSACSENVPAGPRNAISSGFSSPRQADITSRQIDATLSPSSGPGLAACTLRMTCSSRSGRNTGAPYFFLTSPTSRASWARRFSSASSSRSTASIWPRSGARSADSACSWALGPGFPVGGASLFARLSSLVMSKPGGPRRGGREESVQTRRQAAVRSNSRMKSISAVTPSSGIAL